MRAKSIANKTSSGSHSFPILPFVAGEVQSERASVGKRKTRVIGLFKSNINSTQKGCNMTTKFEQIAEKARTNPEFVFTSIGHLLTPELLKSSFTKLRKNSALGSDGISYNDYETQLSENINRLHKSLKDRSYRVGEIKRVWRDKGDGKKRPIGISCMEDRIIQKAVLTLLNTIYEQDFYDFSYGFREKRNAHQALHYFRENSMRRRISWFINIDISGCFDNFSHKTMRSIIRKRVNDGFINWLIDIWMKCRIVDGSQMTVNELGTPQGSIISPLLANIYLHETIDKWIEEQIKPLLKGEIFIVRYADDFIIGLEYESDAKRLYEVLPKRLSKYGLSINKEKSSLQHFVPENKERNNTIDYLGFTHFWSKSRLGNPLIKRQTRNKSKKRILKSLYDTIKSNRHKNLKEQFTKIKQKLLGYYQYYAIRNNYPFLNTLYYKSRYFWVKMLNHRGGRKKSYSKETFSDLLRIFVIPKPRILHRI